MKRKSEIPVYIRLQKPTSDVWKRIGDSDHIIEQYIEKPRGYSELASVEENVHATQATYLRLPSQVSISSNSKVRSRLKELPFKDRFIKSLLCRAAVGGPVL